MGYLRSAIRIQTFIALAGIGEWGYIERRPSHFFCMQGYNISQYKLPKFFLILFMTLFITCYVI